MYDLYNAFTKSREDLTYPLRKEIKRDRYILNSKGLKESIENLFIDYCKQFNEGSSKFIKQNITDTMNSVINNINLINNKYSINNQKVDIDNSYFLNILAKEFVKALAKIINAFLDIGKK